MKRILSVVLLLLAVVGGLLLCDRATRRDDAERKFGSFFSEKQDIDVFFMGTSHVHRRRNPDGALARLRHFRL